MIDPHFPTKIARCRESIFQILVVLGFSLLVVIETQSGVMLVCVFVTIVYSEQVYLFEPEQRRIIEAGVANEGVGEFNRLVL